MTDIVPADKIWLTAVGGYKPVYIGMEEGTPIQLELTPDQTADMSIDVVASMSIDCVPVLANRMAVKHPKREGGNPLSRRYGAKPA